MSSHINALEGFDPNLNVDPFRWIPLGIYLDLVDTRNETLSTGGPVNDNVSGYTNQQLFNAFGSSIISVQGYKSNLLQQNNNSQSNQVISLFSDYHY